MIFRDFKFFVIIFFCSFCVNGQNTLFGTVVDSLSNNYLENVQIFDSTGLLLSVSNQNGYYTCSTSSDTLNIYFIKDGYQILAYSHDFSANHSLELNIKLNLLKENLNTINISDVKSSFESSYISDVVSNSIYAGKKTEMIYSSQKIGNSLNKARNMYNQTVSLNIYQTDEAGLQLNIGGRGLDPRRSANFNIRQNNYDISADPLGYPESYYVPPFECLEGIQLIRGAASLQYGTQFGGLINFNIKKPNKNKTIEVVSRNTFGSNNLYTNFTSFSGTVKKFGYYVFFNHKEGDGFRSNADYYSNNLYSYISYTPNSNLSLSMEVTFLDYLAHQPGGLTDNMFYDNIFQSNRERNWFKVNWLLYNFQSKYVFSTNTSLSINSFVLKANRSAIGFQSNRVDQVDSFNERDLITADFNNFGIEGKVLHEYELLIKKIIFLIGSKFYSGNNETAQGPGSSGFDADFNFAFNDYPNYENQSNYSNPNINYSIFSEKIIYLNNKMSIVPGFRFEFIETASEGFFRDINTDAADNVILNQLNETNYIRERSFCLFGLGYSYKIFEWSELYSNISQNYRAVTFSDINIINPSFIIDPNIKDENGYTFDVGFRGNYRDFIFYDIGAFSLFYNDHIGFIQREFDDGSVKNQKGNIGDAHIFGQELLLNFNLNNILNLDTNTKMNYYVNMSTLKSEYVDSQENGVKGNSVEFVPRFNLKTGCQFGYKNFKSNIQYTFISRQYTDATNSIIGDLSGIIGEIPSYDILDFSCSYFLNNLTLEFGVNNILDRHYFTNRATGYPGPGIMPSPSRNIYTTIEYTF